MNAAHWKRRGELFTHICIARVSHTHTHPHRLADCGNFLSCIFISLVCVCVEQQLDPTPNAGQLPTSAEWMPCAQKQLCQSAVSQTVGSESSERRARGIGGKGSPSLSVIQSVGHYGSKSNFKVLSALTAHQRSHWRWHEQHGVRGRGRHLQLPLLLVLHLSGNSLRISEICLRTEIRIADGIVVNFEGERSGGVSDNTHIYGDIEW